MRHQFATTILTVLVFFSLTQLGCVPTSTGTGGAASQRANQVADNSMYQAVQYANANKKGPTLIVLPGKIKAASTNFLHRLSADNIADFAEIELSKANFNVLERESLGPMLRELQLAINMGNAGALQQFRRGRFKSTKWFVKFDILKAQETAAAGSAFDGGTLGSIVGDVVDGVAGSVIGKTVGSAETEEEARVWIIGLRYKIIDASTSEQVATNYIERKMETGQKAQGLLGMSGHAEQQVTIDTAIQALIQQAVIEIDRQK